MEPYLYHGIRDYNLDRLINILKVGFILPKKMLANKYKVNRENQLDLNGQSWISLCQKSIYDDSLGDISPSSFDEHILNHISVVIEESIDNKTYPSHIIYDYYGPEYIRNLIDDNSDNRYSTYSDEIQTNKPISIKKFIAIGYPKLFLLSKNKKETEVKSNIRLIKDTLDEKKLYIPVIDSSYYDFADDQEKIKKYTIR